MTLMSPRETAGRPELPLRLWQEGKASKRSRRLLGLKCSQLAGVYTMLTLNWALPGPNTLHFYLISVAAYGL